MFLTLGSCFHFISNANGFLVAVCGLIVVFVSVMWMLSDIWFGGMLIAFIKHLNAWISWEGWGCSYYSVDYRGSRNRSGWSCGHWRFLFVRLYILFFRFRWVLFPLRSFHFVNLPFWLSKLKGRWIHKFHLGTMGFREAERKDQL